jgi:dihydroorotase
MIGGHSVLDLYNLISLYKDSGFPNNFKEAILMPNLNDPVENVQFYETACLNRGYNVKVFNDKDNAVLWLTNKK